MVLMSKHKLVKYGRPPILLGDLSVYPGDTLRNLGMIFDTHLTMVPHINSVISKVTFALRQVNWIRPWLTQSA